MFGGFKILRVVAMRVTSPPILTDDGGYNETKLKTEV